jgi:hypothetical protein
VDKTGLDENNRSAELLVVNKGRKTSAARPLTEQQCQALEQLKKN